MKLDQVALQLYTLRDHLKTPTDIAASLKKVRSIGYKSVQASGLGPIPEEDLLNLLGAEGLTLCATHESGDTILNDPSAVVERLRKLKCAYTAYPYPANFNLNEPEQVRTLADKLNKSGEVLRQAGQVLTYHNHALELVHMGDATVLEYLYENTDPEFLQGEIDTYWIQYGGGDPVDWCQKLNGRLPLLHLKDYKVSSQGQPTYCEIGAGNLNWKKIIAAAEESGCQWFIVEQDTCPGDPFESIAQSFEYISANLCA